MRDMGLGSGVCAVCSHVELRLGASLGSVNGLCMVRVLSQDWVRFLDQCALWCGSHMMSSGVGPYVGLVLGAG